MSEVAYQPELYIESGIEKYSQSLRSLRALGRVSLDIIPLTSDVPEVQEAWTDFVSALEENIATDPELSEKLTFNPIRRQEVIDGHVVDRTGRRIIDLVSEGVKASKQHALFDTRMNVQVERDEGDVMVAQAVDELVVGEMLAVVSMDPKEALSSDKEFWEEKGYREGMAVLQVYYRTGEGLLAGAYAIKDSDTNDLRDSFADYGYEIPESENCNRWTRHHLKLNLTEIEARSFGDEFVRAYRHKRGLDDNQISTSKFLERNQTEVQSYFDAHIIPVATSVVTGVNNESTQSLAASFHQYNSTHINSRERSRLLKVANSNKFDDNDARFMEAKVRYALIEHLRPKLKELFEVPDHIVKKEVMHNYYKDNEIRTIGITSSAQLQQMNTYLSTGFGRGAQQNRKYGGCTSSSSESNVSDPELGLQDIFGGKLQSDTESTSGEEDEYGSLVFECTKGHKNKRPKGKLIPKCTTCDEDVSCG